MKKIFCFGEFLLRFSPLSNQAWIDKTEMPVYIGGAELNTATALAKWGMPVTYCSSLPDNSLTHEIINYLESKHIDTSNIIIGGKRIGTYYLPQGTDLKHSGVIYDREHSSFSALVPGQINWHKILKEVSWFHFSAICPALNDNIAVVCKEAVQTAAELGIPVSVDLNYRAKLWQYGKNPYEVMPGLVKYADIIMGNIWSVEKMLGINIPDNNAKSAEEFKKLSYISSVSILERYRKCTLVANTFRFDHNAGINYYATMYDGNEFIASKQLQTESIVDKVGSGDCFMGGLIYGKIKNYNLQEIVDFSAGAAFSKLFIKGDATTASVEQIKNQYMQYA